MKTWKQNNWGLNAHETMRGGNTLNDVQEKVRNSLKLGKKYKLQSNGEEMKMKLIAFHPHVVVFQKSNGMIETFTYWDIFYKTRLCG